MSTQSNTPNNTTILSWDVGIKNLAFCIIHKNDDIFAIRHWGVINISLDENRCEHILKNGTQCTKNVKYQLNDKNFCEPHKKSHMPKIVKSKGHNHCDTCNNTSTCLIEGSSNYACDEHSESIYDKHIKTNTHIKKITNSSCIRQPIQQTAKRLYDELSKYDNIFLHVNEIIIENQPTLKNPTMKTIASLLLGYFIFKGMTNVKFVSPSNKLKIGGDTTKKTYKLTKKLGIKYCCALICDVDREILNTHTKKDDMCDAFLQGFQYLFRPVPQVYVDKIIIVGQ